MIRDIILVCGCKVELTLIPPGSFALLDDTPIQGVLTYPCVYHTPAPGIRLPNEKILIQGLN